MKVSDSARVETLCIHCYHSAICWSNRDSALVRDFCSCLKFLNLTMANIYYFEAVHIPVSCALWWWGEGTGFGEPYNIVCCSFTGPVFMERQRKEVDFLNGCWGK